LIALGYGTDDAIEKTQRLWNRKITEKRHLPSLIKGGFYKRLAVYGHVGRMDIGLPWEVTDKICVLRG